MNRRMIAAVLLAAALAAPVAAAPLKIQLNQNDYRVTIANDAPSPLNGANLTWAVWDVQGNLIAGATVPVQAPVDGVSAPLDIGMPALLAQHKLLQLRVSVRDANNQLLTQDVYWPSATPQDRKALAQLPQVRLSASARWLTPTAPGVRRLEITLNNGNRTPILTSNLALLKADGSTIHSAAFSENDLSLPPGETRTITVTFQSEGRVRLALGGANVMPQTLDVDNATGLPGDGLACSTTPAPRQIDYPWMKRKRWQEMFNEDVAVADKGEADLLFVGDSITEGWTREIWERSFGGWRAANFGIGGDHTGNVLWRLQNGHAGKLHPRLVVLTIGVNNLSFCSATPEQTFAGIRLVVAQLRRLYPDARILLNAVLPKGQRPQGDDRLRVLALNRMVATLNDGRHVFYHDYGQRFLQPNGEMSPEVMGDFLHPTAKGYQIWADAMLPDIRKLME